MMTLGFAARRLRASALGGLAAVTVLRTGGAIGTVSVDFATADGTALAGEHYESTSGTFVFGDGATSKVIFVPLHRNGSEGRQITVTLMRAGSGARLGLRRTIIDIPAAH